MTDRKATYEAAYREYMEAADDLGRATDAYFVAVKKFDTAKRNVDDARHAFTASGEEAKGEQDGQ